MQQLPLHDFYKMYKDIGDNDLILDVRTADEYDEGTIEGSQNISHEQILEYTDKLKAYDKIYIFCRRGGRAQNASNALIQVGFDNIVCIHDAGMDLWKESGYPVTTP